MIKSIKVRLNPNNKQLTKLFQYAGVARFAYNWSLSRQEENYDQGGKFIQDGELRKEFTQLKKQSEYQWLNGTSCDVTKQAIKDCCNAYKRFFKGLAKYPSFKSKKKSTPSFYQDTVKITFTDTHVKVEGFAMSRKKNKQRLNWIRLCEKGRIPTNCKYMNPRFTYDGMYWYVSVSIEIDDNTTLPSNDGIGIDLGIKDLAICSDGNTYKNINKTNKIQKLEKKKCWLQRSVSRKYEKNKKGERYCKTSNIIKREKELLKVSRRLTNIRHNYLHQTTSETVQQQCFSEFRRQIEYKSEWNNISVIVADRFFPSSKLCSCCGNVKKNLKLSDRTYICECGNVIDRDYQAALNLKNYGENVLQSAI